MYRKERYKTKKPLKIIKIKRGFVLGTGLEPVRPNGHWILSPTCLPIPPPERGIFLGLYFNK